MAPALRGTLELYVVSLLPPKIGVAILGGKASTLSTGMRNTRPGTQPLLGKITAVFTGKVKGYFANVSYGKKAESLQQLLKTLSLINLYVSLHFESGQILLRNRLQPQPMKGHVKLYGPEIPFIGIMEVEEVPYGTARRSRNPDCAGSAWPIGVGRAQLDPHTRSTIVVDGR
jgi:hypothetical protein